MHVQLRCCLGVPLHFGGRRLPSPSHTGRTRRGASARAALYASSLSAPVGLVNWNLNIQAAVTACGSARRSSCTRAHGPRLPARDDAASLPGLLGWGEQAPFKFHLNGGGQAAPRAGHLTSQSLSRPSPGPCTTTREKRILHPPYVHLRQCKWRHMHGSLFPPAESHGPLENIITKPFTKLPRRFRCAYYYYTKIREHGSCFRK